MFVGHLAVGFAAKKAAPRTSLGTLLMATVWSDILFAILLLVGVERVSIDPSIHGYVPIRLEYFPWSHSLTMTLVWAVLVGGFYYGFRRYRVGALCLGVAVLSHWLLDWATHRPDMTLSPGMPTRYGLGLYDHPLATFMIEMTMFVGGLGIYIQSTKARDGIGRWGLAGLVVLLSLLYVGSFFMPPPPDTRSMALANSTILIFLLWAAWIDRHRDST